VITTKALLLEGLRAYPIAKQRKHATKAAIKKEIFVG
jgi:hypothetical protein